MSAHTPEPWKVNQGGGGSVIWPSNENALSLHSSHGWDHRVEGMANCDRVVACVNAFQGVADPAAELARLRACEEALRGVMQWWALDTGDLGIDFDIMPSDVHDAAVAALAERG